MSTTATTTTSPAKSKKEKDKERPEKAAPHPSERLKTVVRRLPPNLPEEVFWQTVQKWVSDETATWKSYYSGKFKKRMNKENIPSRAYIAFKNEDLLVQFSREFDGHLFKDKAGNESYAIVEYAPHQKVPLERRKPDNKNDTIDKDDDYISFINALNAPTGEAVTIESLIAATRAPEAPKTTPLLEALKAEKSAQKDKEAILRNHAHYKDHANIAAIASNPSRKEEKKKGGAPSAPPSNSVNQPSKLGDAPPVSKKAAKKAAAQAAQKAATPAKNVNANDAKAQQPPATPSKQSKQQKQTKTTPAQPAPAAPTAILAAKPALKPAANDAPSSSTAGPSAAPAPATEAPRRARPVIGRQLEAALAGVGASARARKEREKERAKEMANADAKATTAAAASPNPPPSSAPSVANQSQISPVVKAPGAQPAAPASPASKQRNRRGGAPANPPTAHQTTPAAGTSNVQKPPGNAQRPQGGQPAVMQKAGNASTGSVAPGVIVPPPGATFDRGRGGFGGGRGRGGRGRGGRGGTPAARGG